MGKVRLLRALNDNDIIIDPNKSGIISKKLMYDVVRELIIEQEPESLHGLTIIEEQTYILERLKSYIINNRDDFNRLISERMCDITKLVKGLDSGDFSARNYILMQSYLSGLLSHIRSGSKIATEWISSTRSLKALNKYYQNQQVNKVALIETDFFGYHNGNTFCINLSSKDAIEKVSKILPKQIDKEFAETLAYLSVNHSGLGNIFRDDYVNNTSIKFPGYNYAVSSQEFCIYNQIIPSEIINVIGKLEMDMILNGILPVEYLKLSSEDQKRELQRIKGLLLLKVKKKNLRLQRAYNTLYVKDINDSSLDAEKNAILKLSRDIKFKF